MKTTPQLPLVLILISGILLSTGLAPFIQPRLWAALLLAFLIPAIILFFLKRPRPLQQMLLIYAAVFFFGAFNASVRKPIAFTHPAHQVESKMLQVRQLFIQHLDIPETSHPEATAILTAMTLGEKSGIDRDTKTEYAIAGTSHILALSGLHLGILYMMLTLLMGHQRRMWKTMLRLIAIWGFVLLVGCSMSVIRAALMLTLYEVTLTMQRRRAALNVWALSLFIILLFDPMAIYDVGMQLSYLAVLSILIYFPTFSKAFTFRYKFPQYIWQLMAVSLSAQIAVAPLVAYYFHRFSVWFLLSNIIAVPLAQIILYVFVAACLCSIIPAVSHVLLSITLWLTSLMSSWVNLVASLPLSSIENLHFGVPVLVALYVIIISLTIAFRKWFINSSLTR